MLVWSSNGDISNTHALVLPTVTKLLHKTRYIEKKTSLYLLCDDYVLSIADGTSVSTFLCTPGA